MQEKARADARKAHEVAAEARAVAQQAVADAIRERSEAKSAYGIALRERQEAEAAILIAEKERREAQEAEEDARSFPFIFAVSFARLSILALACSCRALVVTCTVADHCLLALFACRLTEWGAAWDRWQARAARGRGCLGRCCQGAC